MHHNVLAVVVVLGMLTIAGIFVANNRGYIEVPPMPYVPTLTVTPRPPTGTGSLLDLRNNKSLACSFTSSTQTLEGAIAFVDNQQLSVFASQRESTESVALRTVVTATSTYAWATVGTTTYGVFVREEYDMPDSPEFATTSVQLFDVTQAVDYRCHFWTPQETYFTIPHHITFVDIEAVQLEADVSTTTTTTTREVTLD